MLTTSIWTKLGMPRFRAHDLRATAATGMQTLGVSKEHIRLVLNHSRTGITEKYLRGVQHGHIRSALELWAQELQGIIDWDWQD